MNIPKVYTGGFLKTVKLPRMLFILYFANIFTALLLALPFMGVLKNSFGKSRIVADLLTGFDFTAVSNLMYEHGDAILALFGGIKWLLIAYFLLNIFLTGGIIGTFNKEKFTTSNFFGSAAYNFFRFFGLNLLVLLVQFIFILIVYIPLIAVLKSVSEGLESEMTLYYIAIGGFIFHALIFLIISMIGDYAKFFLVLDNSFNVFKGFWKGLKYVFGHFLKTFFLYLFLLFIPAVIMYLYLYLEKDIKMATGVGILIVFAMQQAFIFLRSFLRAWILGSQYQLYAYDYALTDPVQSVILKVFEQKEEKIKEKTNKDNSKKEQNEPVKQTSKNAYQIDFNSTFSPDNELDYDEKVISEEELLNKFDQEENNYEQTEINQQQIDNEYDTEDKKITNLHQVEDEEETASDNEEVAQNLSEEKPEDQKYSVGDTVEFDDESQSKEEVVDTEQNKNPNEELIAQKMLENIENDEPVVQNKVDEKADVSENLDNEAIIVDDNLDTEAVFYDENLDSEANTDIDFINDEEELDDNDIHPGFEKVEQNVIEDNLNEKKLKEEEKKENGDIIEFEL